MSATDIIRKKRDGQVLDPAEIEAFVQGATHGTWPDYQISALLMAIFLRGMNPEETAVLTDAMVRSGEKLDLSDLPGFKVDKHSTGGVGDKTSLVLAPLVAACGCVVPMMSGRGLGHSGGTLDKLESIPGFRVDLSTNEFRRALEKVGCAMIGQTEKIAPADKVLYALRDVTATVESIPLITGSIMSKKIAEGMDGLVLDVKCGKGAFMKTPEDARELAKSLVQTGTAHGLKTSAYITAMDAPLGHAVGNSLEVIECLETLKGAGPKDLENLSLLLASKMLHIAEPSLTTGEAENRVRAVLSSGHALEKFMQIIEHQGGDPRVVDDYHRFPRADNRHVLTAKRDGFVAEVHAEYIGRAAMLLGAGRHKADDEIDPAVGKIVRAKPGHAVCCGDVLAEVHYRDERRLAAALALLEEAFVICDEKPEAPAQILDVL